MNEREPSTHGRAHVARQPGETSPAGHHQTSDDSSVAEIENIRPADTTPQARHTSTGSALDLIRPGPGHPDAVDELVRERMEEESPDGRPPPIAQRRRSRNLFIAAMAIVWVIVLAAVYSLGGPRLALLALVLTAIYIGYAAWPTWRAALERRGDEERAEREVKSEMEPRPSGR